MNIFIRLIASSLLKHRQIQNSRACAIATAHLLRHVVEAFPLPDILKLIERIQHVGRRLINAQPRELAVGNIVRRVLGVVRGEAEEDREGEGSSGFGDALPASRPLTPKSPSKRSAHPALQDDTRAKHGSPGETAILNSETLRRPPVSDTASSGFGILTQNCATAGLLTPSATPGGQSPSARTMETSTKDVRADVVDGIGEIVDELEIVDDQIAGAAPEYVRANDVVLVQGNTRTVQKFLLKAAAHVPAHATAGAKFTVVHATEPPDPSIPPTTTTPATEDGLDTFRFAKPLLEAKVAVEHIAMAATFALMPRVHRVLLAPRAVLADGGLIGAAGARSVAEAARAHHRPVLALAGVFKLSPEYPFDVDSLLEHGGVGDEDLWDGDLDDQGFETGSVEVENPVDEHVPADLVDLFITNLYVLHLLISCLVFFWHLTDPASGAGTRHLRYTASWRIIIDLRTSIWI